jgi:hypothetical protein
MHRVGGGGGSSSLSSYSRFEETSMIRIETEGDDDTDYPQNIQTPSNEK